MRIGQVAEDAGVNIDTLRYYERRGLLAAPARRTSGYRDYPEDTVPIVRFIKRAQDLGFTLQEIEELLSFRDAGKGKRRAEVRALAEAKLQDIERKISHLSAMGMAVVSLVDSCNCRGEPLDCPILEALNDVGQSPELERQGNGK